VPKMTVISELVALRDQTARSCLDVPAVSGCRRVGVSRACATWVFPCRRCPSFQRYSRMRE
jgi:hypothetical protein